MGITRDTRVRSIRFGIYVENSNLGARAHRPLSILAGRSVSVLFFADRSFTLQHTQELNDCSGLAIEPSAG